MTDETRPFDLTRIFFEAAARTYAETASLMIDAAFGLTDASIRTSRQLTNSYFQSTKKIFNAATELPRAIMEYSTLQMLAPHISRIAPKGDGHPVLVLPGFTANDISTKPLRRLLQDNGYSVHGWRNGLNLGPKQKTLLHMKARLEKISREHGGQKVTIIGHSLGGIYARELARDFPHLVRDVYELGSPFAAGNMDDMANSAVRKTFELINGEDNKLSDKLLMERAVQLPPGIPNTAIGTDGDGVVNVGACFNPGDDDFLRKAHAENLKVPASHCGLVMNPLVTLIILDRLAQKPKQWKPFDPAKYPGLGNFIQHVQRNPRLPPYIAPVSDLYGGPGFFS